MKNFFIVLIILVSNAFVFSTGINEIEYEKIDAEKIFTNTEDYMNKKIHTTFIFCKIYDLNPAYVFKPMEDIFYNKEQSCYEYGYLLNLKNRPYIHLKQSFRLQDNYKEGNLYLIEAYGILTIDRMGLVGDKTIVFKSHKEKILFNTEFYELYEKMKKDAENIPFVIGDKDLEEDFIIESYKNYARDYVKKYDQDKAKRNFFVFKTNLKEFTISKKIFEGDFYNKLANCRKNIKNLFFWDAYSFLTIEDEDNIISIEETYYLGNANDLLQKLKQYYPDVILVKME